MTDTTQATRADAPVHYGAAPEVKQKHRAMWALGDYPAVAADIVAPLGQRARRGLRGRRRRPAARRRGRHRHRRAPGGARRGRASRHPTSRPSCSPRASATPGPRGSTSTWDEGDAEALPYADGAFDVTTSCVGVMFAPFHQAAADELVRVTRPGGRIGLVSWTPEGFIGQMFSVMRPYAPPPPPGCPAGAAVGVPRRTCATCSATASTTSRPAGQPPRRRPVRRRRRLPRLLQGALRPDDRRLPLTGRRHRHGGTSSTPRSPTSATSTSTTAPWRGSTCCSPPAAADRSTADAGPPARRAPRHPRWSPSGPHRAPHEGCRCGSLRSAA